MSYPYLVAFAGNWATFTCGTFLTWASPELEKLMNNETTPFPEPISQDSSTWVSSAVALAGIPGPFVYGYLSDHIGRKPSMLLLGVPFLIGLIMMAFGERVWMFYVARLLGGLAIGGMFAVYPNYIGEMADSHNRGALMSSFNVFMCAGMLVSFSVGPYVSVKTFNLILLVFPVIYLVLFFLFAPETAYYHMMKGNEEEAKKCLQMVRAKDANVEKELALIKDKIEETKGGRFWHSIFVERNRRLTKAFIISFGLVLIQQFTGITAILFYSQQIFQDAGVEIEPAICSILVGVVQFTASFFTPLVVDRVGRKVLLYFSAIGMMLTECGLAIYCYLQDNGTYVKPASFVPIICLMGYIVSYNVGFGPLPWAMTGEMFPSNLKSPASSAVAALAWPFGFLITKYFQVIKDSLGMGSIFLIFSISCGLAIPFTYFFVLETKGKSLQQIQEELER